MTSTETMSTIPKTVVTSISNSSRDSPQPSLLDGSCSSGMMSMPNNSNENSSSVPTTMTTNNNNPPPRIVITSSAAAAAAAAASMGTPKSSKSASAGSEKIGRWTEAEHQVFLDGLGKHGKQWKVIAGMIGTRTVVQVRTHAQKYFLKMERKNKPVVMGGGSGDASVSGDASTTASSSIAPAMVSPKPTAAIVAAAVPAASAATSGGGANKRKSLPPSLPSRKATGAAKKVAPSPKKHRVSISLSSNLNNSSNNNATSSHTLTPCPQPSRVVDFPMFASASSENLSTISPQGVMDFENISGADSFHGMDPSTCITGNNAGDNTKANGDGMMNLIPGVDDFVVGDPLEWLMDNCDDDGQGENNMNSIVHLLPESSLADHPPLFPDFQDLSNGASNGIQLQPSTSTCTNTNNNTNATQNMNNSAPQPAAAFHQQPQLHLPTSDSSSCYGNFGQHTMYQPPVNMVSFPDLPNLGDPNVTVQSLFMDGE